MFSAVFCDFDNVYLSLQNSNPKAADAFARAPSTWLAWLTERGDENRRRILLRNVYLNSRHTGWTRDEFLRAGFRVLECPSMTKQGKSSADMHMCIDALDALAQADPRIDEFLILSSDSDFAPLLLRLRERGRRTSILALGDISLAYAALANNVIDESEFVRDGLGMKAPTPVVPAPESTNALLLREMARKMAAEAAIRPLSVRDLTRFYKMFPGFANSDWLGFRSVRKLTLAVVETSAGALMFENAGRADWTVKSAVRADANGVDLHANIPPVPTHVPAPTLEEALS